MRPIVRSILVGLLVLVALAAAASRFIEAGVTEFYSPGWYSASSAEASRRGVLVRQPIVRADSLTLGGAPLRVADAWIEHKTHVEYRWFLWRREIRDPELRLVVLTRRDSTGAPEIWCDEGLGDDYDGRFARSGTSEQTEWYTIRDPKVDPPFPDTIRLVMHRRGECRPRSH